MATVVVVSPRTPLRSSISSPACVIVSSVDNGGISDIVPTKVVLPTAKCPTIRIFTAVCAAPPRTYAFSSKTGPETIQHLLKNLLVDQAGARHRRARDEVTAFGEGIEKDLHHAHGQTQVSRDLGDREVAAGAHLQQALFLRGEPGRPLLMVGGRRDQRDQGELVAVGEVPAIGDDVRPH